MSSFKIKFPPTEQHISLKSCPIGTLFVYLSDIPGDKLLRDCEDAIREVFMRIPCGYVALTTGSFFDSSGQATRFVIPLPAGTLVTITQK